MVKSEYQRAPEAICCGRLFVMGGWQDKKHLPLIRYMHLPLPNWDWCSGGTWVTLQGLQDAYVETFESSVRVR